MCVQGTQRSFYTVEGNCALTNEQVAVEFTSHVCVCFSMHISERLKRSRACKSIEVTGFHHHKETKNHYI